MLPRLRLPLILLAALPLSTAHISILYASSYTGNVTTLQLDHEYITQPLPPGTSTSTPECNYNLRATSSVPCPGDASWLTLNPARNELYCIGEGLAGITGGLTIYAVAQGGRLLTTASEEIRAGAVNALVLGPPLASGPQLVLAN